MYYGPTNAGFNIECETCINAGTLKSGQICQDTFATSHSSIVLGVVVIVHPLIIWTFPVQIDVGLVIHVETVPS